MRCWALHSQETVAQLAGFENIFDAIVESVHEDRGTMLCRIMPCASRLPVCQEPMRIDLSCWRRL